MKTVRIADGVVIEIMVVPEGMALAECYPAGIVETCFDAKNEVGLGWVTTDNGNTFSAPAAEPAPEPSVPTSVTSAQAKIQLRRAGLRDKVDAAIQAADGEVQDWFTDARVWERNNPHVVDIGTGLGLKPADIDALFEAAAQISV